MSYSPLDPPPEELPDESVQPEDSALVQLSRAIIREQVITESMGGEAIGHDGISAIEVDFPCRNCGYNLRGLAIDGHCPECGAPVRASTGGDLLQRSQPEFIRSLARGTRFLLWGIVITVGLLILLSVLKGLRIADASLLDVVASLLGGLPIVFGAWLLSARDPSGIGEDRYGTSRKFIRVMLVLCLLDYPIAFVADMAGSLTQESRLIFFALQFLLNLAGLAGIIALLVYLKKLALRIPDRRLSQRAHTLIWGIAISCITLLAFAFITAWDANSPDRFNDAPLIAFGCLAFVAALALLVCAVMYITMLYDFGARLRQQATIAGRYWKKAALLAGEATP